MDGGGGGMDILSQAVAWGPFLTSGLGGTRGVWMGGTRGVGSLCSRWVGSLRCHPSGVPTSGDLRPVAKPPLTVEWKQEQEKRQCWDADVGGSLGWHWWGAGVYHTGGKNK